MDVSVKAMTDSSAGFAVRCAEGLSLSGKFSLQFKVRLPIPGSKRGISLTNLTQRKGRSFPHIRRQSRYTSGLTLVTLTSIFPNSTSNRFA